MTTTVRPCGDRALLLECDDPAGTAAAIARAAYPGVVEVIPAATTVLVQHEASTDRRDLSRALALVEPDPLDVASHATVTIRVRYDGDDLHDVASLAGLSPEAVVALHSAATYTVAFCGFAPGFAYLRGLDPRLVVPRLATPRTRVPAGAVAIADTWSAVYPRESPGGWRLLGRTDAVLWDVDALPPSRLAPGAPVRFVETA